MNLTLPEFSLVLLVGPSGSGKSTFARRHFLATEIVSSDVCRGLVGDDANDQTATGDAFALLHATLELRLKRRRLTVVDATNVRPEDRKLLIAIAKRWHALVVAIVIDPGDDVCHARNATRPDRQFGPHVVRNQRQALRRGLRRIKKEGIGHVYQFETAAEVDAITITRTKLWTDKREETGPFDIIGDVHGCADELEALLATLGYVVESYEDAEHGRRYRVTPPDGRKVVFVGDLVDRGPRVGDTVRLAMDMQPQPPAQTWPGCQAGTGDAGICAGTGRTRTVRRGRAVTPRPRVRVRRAGAGKRAGRSEVVGSVHVAALSRHNGERASA